MPNLDVEIKLKERFHAIYEAGNRLKDYLNDNKIKRGEPLSVDHGLNIFKLINQIDRLRLNVTSLCVYIKSNPHQFTPKTHETNHAIMATFEAIDEHWIIPYEIRTLNALICYLVLRENTSKPHAFMAALEPDNEPSMMDFIKSIEKQEVLPIKKKTKALLRLQSAIIEVMSIKRRKRKAWINTYEVVQEMYHRVDHDVKKNVQDHAKAEYEEMLKLHHHFMRWINFNERVLKLTERNINELSANLDVSNNEKAKLCQMVMRGLGVAALTPVFMGGFLDPAITLIDRIIQIILLRQGIVDINLQQDHIYKLTGLVPDANKKTYKKAYETLMRETRYDRFERYKRYLEYKISTLSKTKALSEPMSNQSTIWGGFTPDEILRALRMKTIEASHYDDPNVNLPLPEKDTSLIAAMTKPLNTMVSEIFEPLKLQYGDKQRLEGLHTLLDRIEFNDDIAGPEGHNHQRENSLIATLSNHLEIHLIVKYLVEETRYFGGESANYPLIDNKRDIRDDDYSFGVKPDNTCIRELVMVLIKRIIRTNNDGLKRVLGLDPLQTEEEQIKNNLLVGWTIMSSAEYHFHRILRSFFNIAPADPGIDHQKRRQMIYSIIEEYYYCNIGELMQRHLIEFANYNGITLTKPSHHPDSRGNFIAPIWISEDSLGKVIHAKTQPFIDQATVRRKLCHLYFEIGTSYKVKRDLIRETSHERSQEISEMEEELKKPRYNFNDS